MLVTEPVTEKKSGYVRIILEDYQHIEARGNAKQLPRKRIGEDYVLAYDETKRMLAICGTKEVSFRVVFGQP